MPHSEAATLIGKTINYLALRHILSNMSNDGRVENIEVIVRIDPGASHAFISPNTAEQFDLKIVESIIQDVELEEGSSYSH